MNRLARILGGLLMLVALATQAVDDPAIARGQAWLAAQIGADGAIAGEALSVATAAQLRGEVLHTQAAAGSVAPALLEAVEADTAIDTEYLARRAVALRAASGDSAGLAAKLRANAAAGGGFGARPGQPANPLDTAFALIALRTLGETRDATVAQALGYLAAAADADGGYGGGQRPYATSYALLALHYWRADYDLAAALGRTRGALLAMRVDGVYADVLENAIAAIALQTTGPAADAADAIGTLREAQAADGSWNGDAYLTALALRALRGEATQPGGDGATITGIVIDQAAGTPLAGATVSLAGGGPGATSGADGRFQLAGVAAGSQSVHIARAGYQSRELPLATRAGVTSDLGTVALAALDGSAILRGVVTDTRQHLPQAGVTVALSGAVTLQTVTDAQGRYEFVGLPAGTVVVTTSKAGFTGNSEPVELFAREVLWYSTWVCPSSDTPPTAGTAVLQGRLVDAADQRPVAGAQIVMGARTVSSDAGGAFAFEPGPTGSFAAEVRAAGYLTVTLSGTLASGVNDAGTIALIAGPSDGGTPTASTLVGRVTHRDTGAPLAGVHVLIDGSERALTGDDGDYRIADVDALRVALSFRAVGFESQDLSVETAAFGVYRIDRALAPTSDEAAAFQILGFSMQPAQTAPGEDFALEAQIAHLGDGLRNALVLPRVRDAAGQLIANLCGDATPCEQQFEAGQTLQWTLADTMANLPAGPYTLALYVVEPGTITRGEPLGTVLAEASQPFTVDARPRLAGSVNPNPPALIPQSSAGVALDALLRNVGNAPVPAGTVNLEVFERGTRVLAHSASAPLPALAPSELVEISFGNWKPAEAAEYDLVVTPADPAVGGRVLGQLYVGDAARATFTVAPQEVPDGDQTVQGRIAVEGIDHPSGQAADPLFLEVRQAVTDGGHYTGEQAKTWQRSNNCNGCHTQTQSLHGLASSLGKADIDFDAARFMYNSQASIIEDAGRVDLSHDSLYIAQSSLALWSMGAWPERADTFSARYRIADYLHGRRNVSGDRGWWVSDYTVGWLNGASASTAVVLEGYARVLRDADELGLSSWREVQPAERVAASANAGARFIDAGPDGRLYEVSSTQVKRIDPDTGAVSVLATPSGQGSLLSLAVAESGEVYVATSLPALLRIAPDGSVVQLTRSLPSQPVDLDVLPSGDIVVLSSNRTLTAVTPAGAVRTLASAGLLPSGGGTGIAAFADGSVRVVHNGVHGWVRVAPDGSMTREDYGLHYRPIDMQATADGGMAVTFEAAGSEARGLIVFTPEGIAERLRGIVNTARVAVLGDRLFTLNNNLSLSEAVLLQSPATRLDDLRADMAAAARHLLTLSATTSSNTELAFGMIGLSEARPYADAALVALIDARVAALGQTLRARQRPDGGWGPANGNTSDALSTAIVGTALDYLAPAPTDPVLRKTVQYLLTIQDSDGSWPTGGRWFPTKHGSTSYVMAYLPKAIARLGGIEVDLALELPADIHLANPNTAPAATTPLPEGRTRYDFDLGRVTSTAFDLRFDLRFDDLFAGETRAAATAATLQFRNSFNGELVEIPVAIPSVRARNGWTLELALNRDSFHANEQVDVLPTVRNLDSLADAGSLRYFIETPEGEAVAQLETQSFTGVSAGAQRLLPAAWNTGGTLAGEYRARVELYGTAGNRLAEAQRPFAILAGTAGQPLLSGAVATDRAEYDAGERVAILGRVRNEAPNLGFADLVLAERVISPAGAPVFETQAPIAQLLPAALLDRSFPFELAPGAVPGAYTVTQTVSDAAGNVLDTRGTTFVVRSTADTGAGLAGTIAATPATIEQGEATDLHAIAINQGNAALAGVPLTIAVVDPITSAILHSADAVRDLPLGGEAGFDATWNTGATPTGDYLAVLQAQVGGRSLTLASTVVRVIEPAVRAALELRVSGDNRLLVLATCRIGNGRAEDTACTAARAVFLDALLTDMGIVHRIVTTTEAFRGEFRSGRYNTYWISGGAEKLANPLAEEVREAVMRGEGLLVDGNHDSRNQILDDALGVRHTGQLPGDAHRALIEAGAFEAAEFAVPGDALRFDPAGAQVHGRFDGAAGAPALLRHGFGRGLAVLHAYDLVRALQEPATAATARALLERSLRQLLGPARSSFVAGSYVEVTADVANLAREAPLVLDLATADALAIVHANPDAAPLAPHLAEWAFVLPQAQTRSFDAGLRLADASGSFAVDASVLHRGPQGERTLATASLALAVVSREALVSTLLADLRTIALAAPSERNARDRVVGLIEQARAEAAAGRIDDAAGTLLRAIDELAKIAEIPTTPYRVQIAEYLGAIVRP